MMRGKQLLSQNPNGDVLYCVACNVWDVRRQAFKPSLEYYHAQSQGHARIMFCRQYPNRATHQIVSIAPAIGWLYAGQDKSGEVVKDLAVAD